MEVGSGVVVGDSVLEGVGLGGLVVLDGVGGGGVVGSWGRGVVGGWWGWASGDGGGGSGQGSEDGSLEHLGEVCGGLEGLRCVEKEVGCF